MKPEPRWAMTRDLSQASATKPWSALPTGAKQALRRAPAVATVSTGSRHRNPWGHRSGRGARNRAGLHGGAPARHSPVYVVRGVNLGFQPAGAGVVDQWGAPDHGVCGQPWQPTKEATRLNTLLRSKCLRGAGSCPASAPMPCLASSTSSPKSTRPRRHAGGRPHGHLPPTMVGPSTAVSGAGWGQQLRTHRVYRWRQQPRRSRCPNRLGSTDRHPCLAGTRPPQYRP